MGGDARAPPSTEGVAGEQEPRDLAVGAPQVDVLPARVRQERAELGEAQGAEHRHDARDHPGGEHQARGADRLRHARRLQEHTRADDDPDDQRARMRQCQVAARFQL